MKKMMFMVLVTLLFVSCVTIETNKDKEFNIQWLDNMSLYMGKSLNDIPSEYKPDFSNKDIHVKRFSNNIREGFYVKKNMVIAVVWTKFIRKQNILISEYEKYLELLKNHFGNPEKIVNEDNVNLWVQDSTILMLYIYDRKIGIMLVLQEAIDQM